MPGYGRTLRASLYWPVLLPTLMLVGLGLLVLSDITVVIASRPIGDWHLRQLSGIVLGFVGAGILMAIPYKTLVSKAYLLYALTIFLLVLVLLVGTRRNAAQRWLDLYFFDVQPSEFMKLALVLTLARFIRFKSSYKTFRGLGTPFLLTVLPMALVLKQPDLGTALLCVPILFTMLFAAGARLRHLVLILVLGASLIYPVYRYGLQPYQRARIDVFLSQVNLKQLTREQKRAQDRNQGYQLQLSTTAIGSGGFSGSDSEELQSTALSLVPERHNDFIFAAVGNRWGLAGCILVVFCFAGLLVSILAVAARTRDPAGRLLCVGVFALFGFQAFVNLAMTVGLMPITGLTLPFLSYGRSSAVTAIVAAALVCNVALRPSYEFGRGDFD